MSRLKILILIIIVFLGFAYLSYYRGVNDSVANSGENREFIIDSGMGAKQIGQKLYNEGLITSTLFFEIYIWREDLAPKLQAGIYQLSPAMKLKEVANILVGGANPANERSVKLIEGWNASDMAKYFEKEGLFSQTDFLAAVNNPAGYNFSSEYSILKDKPASAGLEGYLFPDTYRIYADSSVEDMVEKMLDNLESKFSQEMRVEAANQGKSIYQILTMASLIEKEVRSKEDMKIVSGIFWDRIKNGQALQSCATLAYVLGENKAQYTKEDTEINSPYNTYQNQGLPPGPIANPGINAIEAALYPTYTDYNYFLTANDGTTIFSVTYDEHVRNKAKYLD